MRLPDFTLPNLTDWGLSPQAASALSREPEILKDLVRDRQLAPFPFDYVPTTIEVLFDDIPYIRSLHGELTYLRDCEQDYQPLFIEYRFDDEIALFQVNGEYVVNRIEAIAENNALNQVLNFGGD